MHRTWCSLCVKRSVQPRLRQSRSVLILGTPYAGSASDRGTPSHLSVITVMAESDHLTCVMMGWSVWQQSSHVGWASLMFFDFSIQFFAVLGHFPAVWCLRVFIFRSFWSFLCFSSGRLTKLATCKLFSIRYALFCRVIDFIELLDIVDLLRHSFRGCILCMISVLCCSWLQFCSKLIITAKLCIKWRKLACLSASDKRNNTAHSTNRFSWILLVLITDKSKRVTN